MKLCVLFPGIGYHCEKPLLYYPAKLAKSKGYDVIPLKFSGFDNSAKGNEEKMSRAAGHAIALAAEQLSDIDFSQYEKVVFIGKSIGTIACLAYRETSGVNASCILLTPLEMTFDADKTVTVKVDGNVLSHSNGQRMYKVNYAEKHDFSVGYLAMKATEVETYVDNIRVVEYDTTIDPSAPQPPAQSDIDPTGDVSETPTELSGNNGSGDVGGSTTPVKTGGCGSSIGAVSAISLVVAASLVLVFTKLRHLKK